jgi:hypothetical protein
METKRGMEFPIFGTRSAGFLADNGEWVNLKDRRAIVNIAAEKSEEGDKGFVGYLSDRYELVQHEIVYNAFRDAIGYIPDLGDRALTVNCYGEHGEVMIATLMLPKFSIQPKVGDVVQMGIKMRNSVDGSTNIELIPFSYRLACANGMTHFEAMKGIKVRHMSQAKVLVTNLDAKIAGVIENFSVISEKYKTWVNTKIKISVDDLIKKAEPVMPDKKLWEKVKVDEPKTAWDLFNSMTYFNSHTRKVNERNGDNSRIEFDRRIMSVMKLV